MKKEAGFTLMEAVVVIAITIVCGAILTDIFIGHNRIYKVETAELNITNDARTALDDIDNYTRQASHTLSTYSSYSASDETLILEIQSINASNQLVPGTFDTVVYYLVGSDLYRQVFVSAAGRIAVTKKIARNVTDLTFVYDNADYSLVKKVSTNITIQENAGVSTKSITISSEAKLRNNQ